jgi:hypothetical protein
MTNIDATRQHVRAVAVDIERCVVVALYHWTDGERACPH